MKHKTRLLGIFLLLVVSGTSILIFLQSGRTKRELDFATKQRRATTSPQKEVSGKPIQANIDDPNLSFSFRIADGAALLSAAHVLALSLVGENRPFDALSLAREMEKQSLIPPGMAFLEPSQDFPAGLFVSHRLDGFFILRCQSNSGVIEILTCPRTPGKDGEPALLRFPESFGSKTQAALFIAPNSAVPIPPYRAEMYQLQQIGWFAAPFNPDSKSEVETIAAGLWRAKHPADPR